MGKSKIIHSRKFDRPVTVYAITDAHIGNVDHDKDHFDAVIKLIQDDPDAYCFFNGDTMEWIPPNYGISESGQNLNCNQQKQRYVDLIKGLGDKVLFIREGNHENRAWKLAGFNICEDISRETGVPCLGLGMEEFWIWVGDRKFRIVSSHGGRNSQKILMNMQLTFQGADLYFVGHTHEFREVSTYQRISTETGEEVRIGFIEMVGGSFLGWADYARENNMRPTQTGCFTLRCSESGIEVKGKV